MTTRKLVGYRYRICEMTPGDSPSFETIRYMEHRDNIEDAQKIIDVLYETDIMHSVYVILAEPVYHEEKEENISYKATELTGPMQQPPRTKF